MAFPRSLRAVPVAVALALTAAPAAVAFVPPVPHALPAGGPVAGVARGLADTWIVGADARSRAAVAIARRFRATAVPGLAAYAVPTRRARAFAAALSGARALAFSEADVRGMRAQSSGPGSLTAENNWRSYVIAPGLTPPPPGPLLVDVDSQVDLTHPAFAGSNIKSATTDPVTDMHGTGVIGIAAGEDKTLGFEGIYPGANVLDVPTGLSCSELSAGISAAVAHGASVLNLSFGSPAPCFTMYLALMHAVRQGILPVASAGNEFLKGNPLSFPASFAHVLTVAASDPQNKPAFFSTANLGVDVTAPGIGIVLPVPKQLDTGDGDQDGYQALSGTSFSSPIVAAMATWIRALRPGLDGGQVADLIRGNAKHLAPSGYDPSTGYGLAQLAPALKAPDPPRSRMEPNDDIPLVDGAVFGKPDPLVWKGRGHATLFGYLDSFKNPADVFRVGVPANAWITLRLHMRVGAARLVVLPRSDRTVAGQAIARSGAIRRDGGFRIANGSHATVVYVDVQAASVAPAYRLTLRRGA